MAEKSYVVFSEVAVAKNAKTKCWNVDSTSGSFLGSVYWHAPWRCYTFHPAAKTVFNQGCLEDIARFCGIKTELHRTKKFVEEVDA